MKARNTAAVVVAAMLMLVTTPSRPSAPLGSGAPKRQPFP